MSQLYGIKYTVRELRPREYIQYSILSESGNRYYIDKLYYGKKYHIDITDKIDEFFKAVEVACKGCGGRPEE